MAWKIHDMHDAIVGTDARKEVGKELKKYDCKKIALLYDHMLKDYLDELVRIIGSEGIETITYQAPPDIEPESGEVEKYVAFCKKENIDGMVALGGGATMDMAKIAGKTIKNGGKVTDYLGGYTALNVGNEIFEPLICIATTSGTGSEVSYGLMCLNEDNGKKTFCLHKGTIGICDPVYPKNMSPYVQAYTGIDAIAHCAESLCNTYAMPNWMADMLCKEGASTGYKYLKRAVEVRDDESLARMSWAAMCGGYAITERKTSIGHTVANQISDNFHKHHGEGVAIGLVVQAMYNIKNAPEISKVWAPLFGVECKEGDDMEKVGQQIFDNILGLVRGLGLKSMKDFGIPEDFCDTAADRISQDKKWVIVPNPPDFEEVRKCLHATYNFNNK